MKYVLGALGLLLLSLYIPTWAAQAPAQSDIAFDSAPSPIGAFATPIYPEAAKKEGIQGKVLIEFTVAVDGSVQASIKKGVRPDLDQAALKAVRDTQWRPAQKDGKPVAATVVVPIQFKLEDKKPGK